MKWLSSAILAAAGVIIMSQSVNAVSSDPRHFITADNIFYSYVNAGEKISVDFVRATHSEISGNRPPVDIKVLIEGPDVERRECVIPAKVSIGKGCRFAELTAKKSGIWRTSFILPESAPNFPDVPLDIHWGGGFFSWDITVKNGSEIQKGRTWTERYAFRQPPGDEFTGDFKTFYVSEDGYIYRSTMYGYNGQISVLSADSVGIRNGDECVSAYQSINVSDDDFSPAFGSCGTKYKLFFEAPAGNLPKEAVRWDGDMEWVRPVIKPPSISELHFNKDNSNDQLSGVVSFYLRNFIGQYEIKIDVDNDGSFDGQDDVLLRQQIRELSNKLQNVRFQGVDKTGSIISPNKKIGVRVEISKVAEIHLIASDVEGRDGLEVVRLNGENAPSSRLCWNDLELAGLAEISLETQEKDGRSCPDSADGLHGWAYGSLSWGNARHVDNWIYASADLEGNNQIVYPTEEAIENETKQQGWLLTILVGAGTLIVVGIVIIFIFLRRRKNRVYNPPPPQPPTDNVI